MALMRLTAWFAISIVFLSACSSLKEDMIPKKLERITASSEFDHRWSNFVGIGQDSRYARLAPVVHQGFLYTVDVKGRLKQLSLNEGDVLWTLDLAVDVGGGIGVAGANLLIGSTSGEVIAVDPAKRSEVWRAQTSSEIVSAPQGNESIVVTSAIDGRVFAFDNKDGTQIWNYDHPVPVLSLRSNSSPLIIGENAFIGFDNGQLLCFNALNGQLVWSARVGQPQGKTELERLVDVDASPVELGPYIYGAGFNSRVIALTKGSGSIAWAQDISTTQNFVATDGVVAIVDDKSHIKAFDAVNGTLLWANEDLHRRRLSSPAVIDGQLVVIDLDGVIHALSLKSGQLTARLRTRHDSVFVAPLVDGEQFFILDTYGEISSYSIESTDHSKESDVDSDSDDQ